MFIINKTIVPIIIPVSFSFDELCQAITAETNMPVGTILVHSLMTRNEELPEKIVVLSVWINSPKDFKIKAAISVLNIRNGLSIELFRKNR